ncbi:hypothetical protein IWX90DRAFT_11410 [Phyllosticta citrichinensis]|uniref:Mid2 domain-containing protein n=1 Tax=Phyllosticta citrichinensis TaxID=1130410 RepID=A0ABR1Y6W1_9PEZI
MAPSPSLQKLSLVCLATATVPAANALTVAIDAAYQVGLLRRADTETCGGDSSLSQCGSKFPDSFCCPAKTHCLGFQGDEGSKGTSTTVICCPEGQDCNLIRPITCDISQQNASLHPSNAVHTTNLTATLTECGSKCCPFGYECNNNQLCAIADTSSSSSGHTSSASASATATATLSVPNASGTASPVSSVAASATASAAASTSAVPAPSSSGKGEKHSNTGAIAGGVVGGVAALVLLVLFAMWCAKRRGTPKKPRYSGDFGPVSRTVSDPIYHPQMSSRTEFLRRDAGSSGNASIDQTLFGSPFSPKSKSPLDRNNTVTSNTSYAYGYTRPNPSPKKSYGSLLRGPGGGMAASNPGRAAQARHYAPSDMQTTTTSNPFTIGQATDDSSSVYTPTPLPRSMRVSTKGKEPARANTTTVGRKPLNPTRILNPTDGQPGNDPSYYSGHPKAGSTETIDVLMPGNGHLAPPPRLGGRSGAGGDGRTMTFNTTFSGLMANAGFGRNSQENVRSASREDERAWGKGQPGSSFL